MVIPSPPRGVSAALAADHHVKLNTRLLVQLAREGVTAFEQRDVVQGMQGTSTRLCVFATRPLEGVGLEAPARAAQTRQDHDRRDMIMGRSIVVSMRASPRPR